MGNCSCCHPAGVASQELTVDEKSFEAPTAAETFVEIERSSINGDVDDNEGVDEGDDSTPTTIATDGSPTRPVKQLPPRRDGVPQHKGTTTGMFGLQQGERSASPPSNRAAENQMDFHPNEPPPELTPRGMGCYLTLEWQSGGTLFLTWHKEHVSGAFLHAIPEKKVPEHKFKQGGKGELARNMQKEKAQFYKGFCDFVKAARVFDSKLEILKTMPYAPLPIKLVFHRPDNTVYEAQIGDKLTLSEFDGVAAVHQNSRTYNCKELNLLLFTQKAFPGGFGMALL